MSRIESAAELGKGLRNIGILVIRSVTPLQTGNLNDGSSGSGQDRYDHRDHGRTVSGRRDPLSVDSSQQAQPHPVLVRTVRPRLANLKPEAALAILELKMDKADQQLCRELLEKNHEGSLTSDARRELEYLSSTITFLDLMRAKALVWLKKAGELDGVALKGELRVSEDRPRPSKGTM